MSYSSFTNLDLKKQFGVELIYREGLFKTSPPRVISDWLKVTLAKTATFALTLGTEKARSEYIIAPIFFELRQQANAQISVFSGVDFEVDKERGLNGFCDFLVSRSTYQSAIEAPVIIAVEAKKENFEGGITQCTAEMIAARIYNERHGKIVEPIYGCVTTGDVWRFLILQNNQALIEQEPYKLEEIEKIIGILWLMAFGENA